MSEEIKTKYYKLIKPEYHDAVKAITGFTSFDFINNVSDGVPYYPVVSGKYPTTAYTRLKEAGVIDLWFEEAEPVRQPLFNEDCWIELDNITKPGTTIALITEVNPSTFMYRLNFPFYDEKDVMRSEIDISKRCARKMKGYEVEQRFKSEMKRRGYFDNVYIESYGGRSTFYIGEGLSDTTDVDVIKSNTFSDIISVCWEAKNVERSYIIWSDINGWRKIIKKHKEPKHEYKVGDFVVCDRDLKGFNQKTFVGLVVACKTDPDISTYYDIMPVNYKLDGEILGSIYWNYGVISRQEHILLKKASYDEILGAFDQEARYRGLYPVGKENAIAKYYSHFDSPTFEVSRTNPVTKLRECYILWSKHSGWVKKSPFKESVETKASGDLVNFTDSCSDCDIDGCSSRGKDDKIDEKVAEAFKTLLDWLDEN